MSLAGREAPAGRHPGYPRGGRGRVRRRRADQDDLGHPGAGQAGYYGGIAVATRAMRGYGAAAVAGAAVGAAATSAVYAATSTNYYPAPYYQPPAW